MPHASVWACSDNVPNALLLLIEASPRLNHHTAPHAFEAVDPRKASRGAIPGILSFLRSTLSGQN